MQKFIKKNLKFCQNHLYKTNFDKWVFTDKTHFWLKNAAEKKWIIKGDDYIQSTTKRGNQRNKCYGAFSKHKKNNLNYLKK